MRELTDRQAQIVELIVEGLSYRQIAIKLGIAERTVRNIIYNVHCRYDVNNNAQLLRALGRLR